MRARPVPIPALAAPVVCVLLLAGCSAAGGSTATAGSSSASTSTGTPAAASVSPSAASGSNGSGSITFTGTYSGTMTVNACDDGQVILDVHTDGHPESSGAIDKLGDFGFNGPKYEVFIPGPRAGRAKRSGKTYTVTDMRLRAGSEAVTANGSVTCP